MSGKSTDVARRLPIVVLLAVTCAIWAPRYRGPIDLRWDAAAYYTLADGAHDGAQVRFSQRAGRDPRGRVASWPAGDHRVTPDRRRFNRSGRRWEILRVTYFVLFSASVLLVYAVLRRHLTPWLSVAGALMASMTMSAVWLSDRA